MHMITDTDHTSHFLIVQGTLFKRLQCCLHLVHVFWSTQTYIHGWMRQDEPVAIRCSGGCFMGGHVFGFQQMAPPRGRIADNTRVVLLFQERNCLCLGATVGGIVADVEQVENTFFIHLGKQRPVVAGYTQKPDQPLFLQGHGSVHQPVRGCFVVPAKQEDVGTITRG